MLLQLPGRCRSALAAAGIRLFGCRSCGRCRSGCRTFIGGVCQSSEIRPPGVIGADIIGGPVTRDPVGETIAARGEVLPLGDA
jgi:hypothetical protein